MKLNNIEMLVSKVEIRKNKKDEAYILIDMLDLATGDNFQIFDKNIELMQKLKTMTKYSLDLNLTSSKYGLRLGIDNIIENLGSV